MKRVLGIVLLLVTATNCKKDNGNSDGKFDAAVFSNLSMYSLKPEEVELICRQSALVVFVGNAEHMVTGKAPGSVAIPQQQTEKLIPAYPTIIRHEANALKEALGFQHSRCKGLANKNPDKLGNMTLLTVIDGPRDGDTQITTTEYSWQRDGRRQEWRAAPDQWWTVDNDDLKKAAAGKKSELHLPTQLTKIVNAVFNRNSAGYNQTIYFFKSHGSRLRVEKDGDDFKYPSPDLRMLAYSKKKLNKMAAEAGHAFLFDAHGPGDDAKYSKTEPAIYSAYWLKTRSCKLLAESSDVDAKELSQNLPACYECSEELGGYPGNFAGCEKTVADALAAVQGGPDDTNNTTQGGPDDTNNTTQGGPDDTNNTTQGGPDDTNNTTQGGPDDTNNTTQGGPDDTNNTTQGGPDDTNNTTQGGPDDTNNTTQGGPDDTNNTTQGGPDDTNNTTQGGPDDTNNTTQGSPDDTNNTTQGTGKGFLFMADLEIGNDDKPFTSPMGASVFASGATYDGKNLNIKGLTDWTNKLPSGNLVSTEALTPYGGRYQPITDKRALAPTLVVLDSCFGDGKFKDTIKNLRDTDDNPVVVVSNPAPLYSTILNYGILDAARYKAFAFVYYWYALYERAGNLDDNPYIRDTVAELSEHLGTEGIYDLPKLYKAIEDEAEAIEEGRFVLDDDKRDKIYKKDLYRQLRVHSYLD